VPARLEACQRPALHVIFAYTFFTITIYIVHANQPHKPPRSRDGHLSKLTGVSDRNASTSLRQRYANGNISYHLHYPHMTSRCLSR
jgi:hypothetical protein